MKKTIINIIIFILLTTFVYSANYNLTSFKDGTTTNNITFSTGDLNETKYLEIPLNSTINHANITINSSEIWDLQERSNESINLTSNWQWFNGFDVQRIDDGSHSAASSDQALLNTGEAIFQFNFSKPNTISSAKLFSTASESAITTTQNDTIPSSCLSSEKVIIYTKSFVNDSNRYHKIECYNGTANITLRSHSGSGASSSIYEIDLFWGYKITNLTIEANGTNIYNGSGIVNSEIEISLNETILNYINNLNETLELFISSDVKGILKYKSLKINYDKNFSANLQFHNPSTWIKAMYAHETASTQYIVNNTGDYNCSSVKFKLSGALNNFLSFSPESDIGINESKTFTIYLTKPLAVLYSTNYLDVYCLNGTTEGGEIHSNIDSQIIISVSQSTTGGGGGGSEDVCGLKLLAPLESISNPACPENSFSRPLTVAFQNTDSGSHFIDLSYEGIKCEEKTGIELKGLEKTIVTLEKCECPTKGNTTTGKIILSQSGNNDCKQSINISLSTSTFGNIVSWIIDNPLLFFIAFGLLIFIFFAIITSIKNLLS